MTQWKHTPFQHSIRRDNGLVMIEMFLDHGADPICGMRTAGTLSRWRHTTDAATSSPPLNSAALPRTSKAPMPDLDLARGSLRPGGLIPSPNAHRRQPRSAIKTVTNRRLSPRPLRRSRQPRRRPHPPRPRDRTRRPEAVPRAPRLRLRRSWPRRWRASRS